MLTDKDVLYHYCSVETFLKILMSQTIWLSHAQTTNDQLEDRMFVSALKQTLEKYGQQANEHSQLLNKMADAYINRLDFPYLCCFSHNKDLLSQWRAYGDDGQGVCIGFDLSKLSYIDLLSVPHGPEISVVMVDEVSYHDKDTELIEKFLSASDILRDKYKYDDPNKILSALVDGMERLSIFTKSQAFSEESEIRMVYSPCYSQLLANLSQITLNCSPKFPIQFRARGSQIISYFEYPIPEDCICEVVIGPKCGIDFKQLTLLLNQYAPLVRRNNKIVYSKISYR